MFIVGSVMTAVGSVSSSGASSTNDKTPATSGATPPIHASSHHPSVGYLAYLVAGWNYCIDEMQHLANCIHFKNGNLQRQNAKGIFLPSAGENTPRGMAWAWRTLAQTVALIPAADPMKANFLGALTENVNYYHATYVAQPNNPFGLLAPYGDAYTPAVTGTTLAGSTSTVILLDGSAHTVPEGRYNGWNLTIGGETRVVTLYEASLRRATVGVAFTVPTEGVAYRVGDDIMKVPVWQEDFITGAIGYSMALGIALGATDKTRLEEFFAWKAQSVVGRFGEPGVAQTFHYCDAAQYELAAAPSDTPDFVGGTGPWYANWGEIYQATLGQANTAAPGDQLRGDSAMAFPSATGYWANMLPALSYAVRHDVFGADTALMRMEADPNWASFLSLFSPSPLWGVKAAPPRMPAWREAMADYTIIELPSANRMVDIDPRFQPGATWPASPTWAASPGVPDWNGALGFSGVVLAWCGASVDRKRSRVWHTDDGGHADYAGNCRFYLDLNRAAPQWVMVRGPSGLDGVTLHYDYPVAQPGSTTTQVVLASGSSAPLLFGGTRDEPPAVDGALVGWSFNCYGNITGTRTVTAYVGATRTITLDAPLSVDPTGRTYTMQSGSSYLGVGGEPMGLLSDGQTRSTHTYNRNVCDSEGNPWQVTQGASSYSAQIGAGFKAVRYDRVTGLSTQHAANPAAAATSNSAACHDPTRGLKGSNWWRPSQGGPWTRYDIAADTWHVVGPTVALSGKCAVAYHPKDWIAWFSGDPGSGFIRAFDPKTGVTHAPPLVGANFAVHGFGASRPEWDPVTGAFWAWHEASGLTQRVWKITPGANPFADAWTIEATTFSGFVPSARVNNGTFGRWAWVPRLRGFNLVNSINEKGAFFALPKA